MVFEAKQVTLSPKEFITDKLIISS